jgi:hypothetical protein
MGLVTHVHTAVFVKGIAAARKLKSHCATCPAHMSVTRNAPHRLQVSASPSTSLSKPLVYVGEWCPSSTSLFNTLNDVSCGRELSQRSFQISLSFCLIFFR